MKQLNKLGKDKILDILFSSTFSLVILHFLTKVGLSSFFILIPFIVINIKYSYKELIFTLIPTFLVSAIYMDTTLLIYNFIFVTSMSTLISELIKRKYDLTTIIVYSSNAIFVGLMLIIFIISSTNDINILNEIRHQFNAALISLEETLTLDVNYSTELVSSFLTQMKSRFEYTLSIIPGILVCYCVLIALINASLSMSILRKTTNEIKIPRLNSIPFGLFLRPLILAFIMIYLSISFISYEYKDLIYKNLLSIIVFMQFLNGVLLIDYKLQNKMNKIVRTLIIIIFIMFIGGIYLISGLGFIDSVFNFRREKN